MARVKRRFGSAVERRRDLHAPRAARIDRRSAAHRRRRRDHRHAGFHRRLHARLRRVVRPHLQAAIHQRRRRVACRRATAIRTAGMRAWRRIRIDAEVSFKEVQPAYDAAVGFTPRRNFRNWNPEVNWQPRFEQSSLVSRRADRAREADINLNLDNHVVDRNLQLTPMELEFHSGDSVEFQLFKQTENLDEDFEISDGVILPVGSSYDWLRYQVGLRRRRAPHALRPRRVSRSATSGTASPRAESRSDAAAAARHLGAAVERVQRRRLCRRARSRRSSIASTRARSSTRGCRCRTTCSTTPRAARSAGSCASGGFRSRATTCSSSGRRTGRIEIGSGFSALDRRGVAKIVRTIRF